MEKLEAPFLELAFFLRKPTIRQALACASGLEGYGRQVAGKIEFVWDGQVREVSIGEVDEEYSLRSGEAFRLPLCSSSWEVPEEEVLELRDGILLLRSNGDLFSGPHEDSSATIKRGKEVSRLFQDLAWSVRPYYAAICLEYSLETPDELRKDWRSQAFFDFFVDGQAIGLALQEEIKELVKGAFISEHDSALYVSMTGWFNPMEINVSTEDASDMSGNVAKVLRKLNA